MANLLLYRCPECSEPMEVSEALVDDVVHCPICNAPFRPEVPAQTPIDETELDEADRLRLEDQERSQINAGESNEEQTIFEVHPALFRMAPVRTFGMFAILAIGLWGLFTSMILGNPLVINGTTALGVSLFFWVSVGLTLVGGGLLFSWWVKTQFTTLTITNKRTRLRKGIISKSSTEVQHDDVRNIQMDQNIVERLLNVGSIAISSSGQDDLEIMMKGVPDPDKIAGAVRDMQ